MVDPSFFENKKYWQNELSKINQNLPNERNTISFYMSQPIKVYRTREDTVTIPEEEFNRFRTAFNEIMYDKIKIPLLILQKKDIYIASGGKYDIWAIERLLGHEHSNLVISIGDYSPKYSYYYTYQINSLRRKYPSLIQIIYSM